MPSILLIHAHPQVPSSRANRALLERAQALPFVTVRDLYALYPHFFVDVAAEQALLVEHDTVVLQHPLYWYSVPPLMKQWIDTVLAQGWAYGKGGTALVGKRWIHAITTGGSARAYGPGTQNRFTLDALLAPLQQTARLCGTYWLAPFVVHSAELLDDASLAAEAERYADALLRLHVLDPATLPAEE